LAKQKNYTIRSSKVFLYFFNEKNKTVILFEPTF